MKTLFCFALICFVAVYGCSKSATTLTSGSGWRLVQKESSFESLGRVETTTAPAADSSVLLELNNDSTYTTQLNGRVISSGSYSITIDTGYYNTPVLQLNNFTRTGIFNNLIEMEVGANGQILSTFSGFYMHSSNDTVTLATPITPGGYAKYTFIKKL